MLLLKLCASVLGAFEYDSGTGGSGQDSSAMQAPAHSYTRGDKMHVFLINYYVSTKVDLCKKKLINLLCKLKTYPRFTEKFPNPLLRPGYLVLWGSNDIQHFSNSLHCRCDI